MCATLKRYTAGIMLKDCVGQMVQSTLEADCPPHPFSWIFCCQIDNT